MVLELDGIAEVCNLDVGNIHDPLAQARDHLDSILSRLTVVLYEDVLGLQVSVNDVKPLHEVHSQKELGRYRFGCEFRYNLVFSNHLAKIASCAKLEQELYVPLCLVYSLYAHDLAAHVELPLGGYLVKEMREGFQFIY